MLLLTILVLVVAAAGKTAATATTTDADIAKTTTTTSDSASNGPHAPADANNVKSEQTQQQKQQQKKDPWRIDNVCDTSNCTYPQLWEGLECDKMPTDYQFFNHSKWMLLRGAYQGTVGPQQSSLGLTDNDVSTYSGFMVDTYMGYTPENGGRIIFAGENIPAGTHVWDGTEQGARFGTGKLFRHFVLSLPPDLGCQMLIRCYPQRTFLNPDGTESYDDDDEKKMQNAKMDVHMMCDFDESSFFGNNPDPNLGCEDEHVAEYEKEGKSLKGGCNRHLFALEDIPAGDPLLVDILDMMYADGFEMLGLVGYSMENLATNERMDDGDDDEYDDEDDDDEEDDEDDNKEPEKSSKEKESGASKSEDPTKDEL